MSMKAMYCNFTHGTTLTPLVTLKSRALFSKHSQPQGIDSEVAGFSVFLLKMLQEKD